MFKIVFQSAKNCIKKGTASVKSCSASKENRKLCRLFQRVSKQCYFFVEVHINNARCTLSVFIKRKPIAFFAVAIVFLNENNSVRVLFKTSRPANICERCVFALRVSVQLYEQKNRNIQFSRKCLN